MRLSRCAMVPAALLLAGCGGGAPVEADDVVGRWYRESERVEFFAGGEMRVKRYESTAAARYDFVAPGRMLVTYQGVLSREPTGDYRVTIRRDSLVLCETEKPDECLRYARAAGGSADTVRVGANGAAARPVEAATVPIAMAQEADAILRQAYTLQDAYRQEHGRFAASLGELAQAGWQDPHPRFYRRPRVVRAQGQALCIEMQPARADLWPQHVDQTGEVRRGACP